jgi:hypothetical protein
MMTDYEVMQERSIPIPITQGAIHTARQFASEQPEPEAAEQVYLNTLAVLAVRDYLTLMEIDTNLQASDSWHSILRTCVDVADLEVKGLGKLECRPLRLAGQSTIAKTSIPPEVWDDRIGYVVVGIDESRKVAALLGFTETVATEALPLNQLRSMDAFLKHLDRLERVTNLSQWFGNLFESPWQAAQSLFSHNSDKPKLDRWLQALSNLLGSQSQEAYSFRHSDTALPGGFFPDAEVMGAKLIDLGMQLGEQTVALLVAIAREPDRKLTIHVQVHPAIGERYLPPHLKLALLSDSGEVLQEVEARGQDLCIQLKPFKVHPETDFKIQVALADTSIIEAFAV